MAEPLHFKETEVQKLKDVTVSSCLLGGKEN